jgi:hypothetical protein
MKDQETVQKFIELRAQGWTYVRLPGDEYHDQVHDWQG